MIEQDKKPLVHGIVPRCTEKRGIIMITEYISELGFDVAKDHIKGRIDERKLRSDLVEYIERQQKYKDVVLLAEEIDFQGLVEYIRNNLLDDVEIRIFNPSRKKRGEARQYIVNMAVSYALATTDEAKHRVSKCVLICLDIIHAFYAKEIDKKDYVLAEKIVDAVAEVSNENTQRVLGAIEENTQIIMSTLENGALFSVDKALELLHSGGVDSLGQGIQSILKHASVEHPLAPLYGFEYSHGAIVSVPLSEEAKKLYPENYKFTGALKIGDKYFNDPNVDPFDYAYRHQLSITMEVTKAVRYLGDIIDPAQSDMKNLVKLYANPPEFPPAFACAIKVGEQTYFEYILLRVREILDDGRIIINNEEQENHICFSVEINPNKPSNPNFTISIHNGNNKELLNYARFMKALKDVKDIHVYVLEAGEDIIAGYIDSARLETGFQSIEEEIDFFERVCFIEDYFNVVFQLERTISKGEYEAVIMISDLVQKDEVTGSWENASFTGKLDQHFREEILSMEDKTHSFSYVGVHHVELFGAEFEFRFMRTFNCVCIDNLEKLKKKVEVLDDGDDIKITIKPGDDKTCIETIRISELSRLDSSV